MSIIEITINKELDDSAKVELKALGFSSIRKKSIFGGDPVIVIIGILGAAVIASLSKIIIELIKLNASVEIEIDGLKIKGISRKTVEEILRKYIVDDND